MSDSGSGSEVEEEYEVEAIINDRSEGKEIFHSKSFESGIFFFQFYDLSGIL